jgi:hypothetical protein
MSSSVQWVPLGLQPHVPFWQAPYGFGSPSRSSTKVQLVPFATGAQAPAMQV